MFKSIITPALIALSLAGAASAGQVSNDAQLAGAAGVAAGQYTAAELQLIINARRDNDNTALNYYLSGTNRAETTGDSSGQLAKLAGVAPGTYSASELQLIINANRENEPDQAAFIISGTNRKAVDAVGTVTAGKAQFAAELGVNAADYTLAQLVALNAERLSDN